MRLRLLSLASIVWGLLCPITGHAQDTYWPGQPHSFCKIANLDVCHLAPQEWQVWMWEPRRFADIPDTTNDWTVIQTGTCTSAKGTTGYPWFRVLTDVNDNDTCVYSYDDSGGWPGFLHQLTAREFYIEFLFRVNEVGADANTVDEMEFFIGLVAASTNIFTTTTDYIGIYKRDQDDDASNDLYFVSGDFGGAPMSQFAESIGWTSEGATLGDSEVAINRAAKRIGPGNWTQIRIYCEQVVGTVLNADGLCHVQVNGFEVAGSPWFIDAMIPDNITMTPQFAIRNGEAASRQIDIARIIAARKMRRTVDGELSLYTAP